MFDAIAVHQGLSRLFNEDAEVAAELRDLIGLDLATVAPNDWMPHLERLAQLVKEGTVTPEFLFRMLRSYNHVEQGSRLEHERVVKETVDEFKAAVVREVALGLLPASAQKSLERLDKVRGSILDVLVMRMGGVNMRVVSTNSVLEMAAWTKSPEARAYIRNSLFHEFAHMISGKDFAIRPDNLMNPVLDSWRLGLRRTNGTGRWFNEAVTERLARRLSGNADEANVSFNSLIAKYYPDIPAQDWLAGVYPNELSELDWLISKGVDERIVYEAYFENNSSETSTRDRAPAFKELIRHMREVFGPNELIRIQNRFSLLETTDEFFQFSGSGFSGLNYNIRLYLSEQPPTTDPNAFEIGISVGSENSRAYCPLQIVTSQPGQKEQIAAKLPEWVDWLKQRLPPTANVRITKN